MDISAVSFCNRTTYLSVLIFFCIYDFSFICFLIVITITRCDLFINTAVFYVCNVPLLLK